ncbi:MAG TPA: multicopper oxidase domain-containing protein [Gemmatimonadaceae bacterium]|jgi:nitrite reductase (NO-forming)|nr:multicopper oxidase domain-containing protein [Gemmatimonadaceae bacterium]
MTDPEDVLDRSVDKLSTVISRDGELEVPSSRRAFLRRASALSLAIPGLGAALTSCKPEQEAQRGATTGADTTGPGARRRTAHNPDSKLDTALHRPGEHPTTTTAGVAGTAASAVYQRFDPTLPPLSDERTLRLHWHSQETPVRISASTVVAGWTFEGNIPGPIVHCRVGDTVEFTLTNDVDIPHSMDFHAAQIDPKVAFRSVPKGQSISYTFKPRYAGAFLYHCGTAPVLMHIGSGMFGAIVVSPRIPLPRAKEFVLVQSEFYLGDEKDGMQPFDYHKMLEAEPDFVAFNGRPDQYGREPIHVKVGDRVRFWVVCAGPTLSSAFHIVGEQFEKVYLGAPPGNSIEGVQTFSVPAGGGMCFELVCDIPGEFPFVNHAFGHGQKGAIGYLVVEP